MPGTTGTTLRRPKNMGVNLKGSQITGIISSAGAGLPGGADPDSDESNRAELSNVTQWAAPTVNNGVVVSLDSGSAWTLTGTVPHHPPADPGRRRRAQGRRRQAPAHDGGRR